MMNKISVGDVYEDSVCFRQEDVVTFAKITGDTNPIHVDLDYAIKSQFGRLVVHGMYAGCSFSKVLGTVFPGAGSINLYRDFTFVRPVFVDEQYTMKFKVVEIDTEHHVGLIKCVLKNSQGQICINCLTRIKNESRF